MNSKQLFRIEMAFVLLMGVVIGVSFWHEAHNKARASKLTTEQQAALAAAGNLVINEDDGTWMTCPLEGASFDGTKGIIAFVTKCYPDTIFKSDFEDASP